jgi:hypothetical protein
MYMRSDDDVWLPMFRFWRRIFGLGLRWQVRRSPC